MRTRLAGGVAVLLVLAAGATYAYFFSGLRSAPRPLALATPSASAPASPTAAGSGLEGTWAVAAGSQARFRVKETVVGLSAPHEAVAMTADVRGTAALARAGSDYQVSAATVTVGLASLHSIDTLAGRDVSQRDGLVQRALSTGSFPSAVFVAQPFAVPGTVDTGQPVSVTIPGTLTLHGASKPVQATVQVQVTGSAAQAVGSLQVDMTDFGVQPPRAPGITPQSATTLEFQLNLSRG